MLDMTAAAPHGTAETLAEGRYELGEVLGRGGIAVTRRAIDRRLGRAVAVKSLVPDPSPEAAAAQRARFDRNMPGMACVSAWCSSSTTPPCRTPAATRT